MTVPVTTTAGVRYMTQHRPPRATVRKMKTAKRWIGHCWICGYNTRSVIWYQAFHTINNHMHMEHGGRV